ncbi:DUF6268 family outer membrane beta-barrel protein [Aquimarina rhabdastrellae]
MKKNLTLICLLLLSLTAMAQMDQYSLEFRGRYIGDNDSDASFQTFAVNKRLARIPIKKGASGLIQIHANYSYAHVNFKEAFTFFEDIENLHNVGLAVNYIKRLKNPKWSFIARFNPQLNSNFTDGIKEDDLYLNAVVLWNYSKTANSRLTFGLAYTNTLGFPAPIPVINYWKKINEKWEFNLGVPRISLVHNLNTKSSITAYLELNGYNANISENYIINGREAERVGYRDIISGLEYRYRIKNFVLLVNGGYTLDRNFELQNSSNDSIVEFNMDNSLNLGLGLGFNF